jgi:hypothetical protein
MGTRRFTWSRQPTSSVLARSRRHLPRSLLAQEIGLKDEHFSAVAESYDVATFITVAKEVFKKARDKENGAEIERLLNQFHQLNDVRKRVAHGLWVPFMRGGSVRYVSRNKLSPSDFTDQAKELERRAHILGALRAELETALLAMPFVIRRRRKRSPGSN